MLAQVFAIPVFNDSRSISQATRSTGDYRVKVHQTVHMSTVFRTPAMSSLPTIQSCIETFLVYKCANAVWCMRCKPCANKCTSAQPQHFFRLQREQEYELDLTQPAFTDQEHVLYLHNLADLLFNMRSL